jgi:hypothetical protein
MSLMVSEPTHNHRFDVTCVSLEVLRLVRLRLEVLRLELLRLGVLRLELLESSLSYPLYLRGEKAKEPKTGCPAYECSDAPGQP